MNLFSKWTRRDSKLSRRVHDLQSEIESRDRIIKVVEAERDAMAAVIARDRARVASETAQFNRQRAEAESDGRTTQ
jgi:hypothetical protein